MSSDDEDEEVFVQTATDNKECEDHVTVTVSQDSSLSSPTQVRTPV